MTRSKKKPVKRGGGERRDLVRESAWIRVYQVKPNLYIQSSKFLDDGLELKASEFEKTWPELSPQEKLCRRREAEAAESDGVRPR